MTNNFDLRKFLSENRITNASQNLDEARYSDSYNSPASKEVGSQLTSIVDIFRKTADEELQELDAAIAAAEEKTGTEVTPVEKKMLRAQLGWIRMRDAEMERESVEIGEEVIDEEVSEEIQEEVEEEVKEEAVNESRETYLTKLVENALGITPAPVAEEANEEMVEENPLPKYKNIDELMKNIEYGTNEAAHKYKMNRMKEIADALEAKVTSLEEGENAEHIDQKAVKAMKKDIMTLRKGVEKLEKEYEKKFAKKEKKGDK